MVSAVKKPPRKVLLYQDGRQANARLGMVDPLGCMVDMVDADQTVRLKFATNGEMVMEAEAEERRQRERADALEAELSTARESLEHMTKLAADMIAAGKFEYGMKGKYKARHDRWRLP